MESKIWDSVLGATEVRRNPANERQIGDTLELSEEGKKLGEYPDMDNPSLSGKKIISDSEKKISDNILTGYSKAKLRQLYANKEITKQQYERIMKKKKIN